MEQNLSVDVKKKSATAPSPVQAPVEAAVQVAPKSKRQLHEERMQKLWEEDSKLVRGVFRNHECPGTALEFPYGSPYRQDQLKVWNFMDGQVYEIPRGLAKHLNNNCNYPVHKHLVDENGKNTTVVELKVQRFTFNPIDFMDIGPRADIAIATPL